MVDVDVVGGEVVVVVVVGGEVVVVGAVGGGRRRRGRCPVEVVDVVVVVDVLVVEVVAGSVTGGFVVATSVVATSVVDGSVVVTSVVDGSVVVTSVVDGSVVITSVVAGSMVVTSVVAGSMVVTSVVAVVVTSVVDGSVVVTSAVSSCAVPVVGGSVVAGSVVAASVVDGSVVVTSVVSGCAVSVVGGSIVDVTARSLVVATLVIIEGAGTVACVEESTNNSVDTPASDSDSVELLVSTGAGVSTVGTTIGGATKLPEVVVAGIVDSITSVDAADDSVGNVVGATDPAVEGFRPLRRIDPTTASHTIPSTATTTARPIVTVRSPTREGVGVAVTIQFVDLRVLFGARR